MELRNEQISEHCSPDKIAAYLDGEIDSSAELALEMHCATCEKCSEELRLQKKIAFALDRALDDEQIIGLPENFTEIVVANAESRVTGLRHSRERQTALLICAGLFLLILLGLGSDTAGIFAAAAKFLEQTTAVVSLIFRLIGDAAVGIAVILRTLSQQLVYKSAPLAAALLLLFVATAYAFSRLIFRFNRIEN